VHSVTSVVNSVLIFLHHREHRGASRYTEKSITDILNNNCYLSLVTSSVHSVTSVVNSVLIFAPQRTLRRCALHREKLQLLKSQNLITIFLSFTFNHFLCALCGLCGKKSLTYVLGYEPRASSPSPAALGPSVAV